jgi:hypothetical protein
MAGASTTPLTGAPSLISPIFTGELAASFDEFLGAVHRVHQKEMRSDRAMPPAAASSSATTGTPG